MKKLGRKKILNFFMRSEKQTTKNILNLGRVQVMSVLSYFYDTLSACNI